MIENKLNIIFLDIDGCLNSTIGESQNLEKHHDMEVDLLELLQNFIYDNKIDGIILSSNRRLDVIDYRIITTGLEDYKIKVLGRTPFDFTLDTRADEILEYLSLHPNIDKYIIFDDVDDNLSKVFKDKFIKINPYFGIIDKDLNKAKKLL